MRRLVPLLAAGLLAGCGSDTEPSPSPRSGPGDAARVVADGDRVRTITIPVGEKAPQDGERLPAAYEEQCPGADLRPAQADPERVEQAVVCLTNLERRQRGLEPLEQRDALAGPAERKARDMAEEDYFAHVGPDGRDVVDWVRGSGYLPEGGGYTLGENIGWAEQGAASPGSIVRSWMRSASHRRNILAEDFDAIGVGVVPGVPREGANPGGTYVQFFGSQTPPGQE